MRAALLAFLLAWPAAAGAQAPSEIPPVPEALDDDPAPEAPPPAPQPFGPRYVLEGIVVRGNHKTDLAVIPRELGLSVGDVVGPTDPRVEAARLRLFSLGYFLDVKFSLEKGARPPGAILVVTVEERGTIVANAIYLGTSEATSVWGGLDAAETNFLGRGIGLGGGFVASTRPKVPGA